MENLDGDDYAEIYDGCARGDAVWIRTAPPYSYDDRDFFRRRERICVTEIRTWHDRIRDERRGRLGSRLPCTESCVLYSYAEGDGLDAGTCTLPQATRWPSTTHHPVKVFLS